MAVTQSSLLKHALSSTVGSQIDLLALQSFLRTSFSFDIPLYALDQLLPKLQADGLVEYRQAQRIHISTARNAPDYELNKEAIETDLSAIADAIQSHARQLGIESPPLSPTWDAALIRFLKARSTGTEKRIVKLRDALLEGGRVEESIVANFVSRQIEAGDSRISSAIVNIFAGIQIEEFISSIAEIGHKTDRKLVIFLDTSILMRHLGCSGRLLKVATDELVENLHDLSIETYFFPVNEDEVGGILDAILNAKDSGYEIQAETAEAVANGEITITQLRILRDNFVENLAASNVFPFDRGPFDATKEARFQIDEHGLARRLREAATERGRAYSVRNSEHDAAFIGQVMRMRGGRFGRDLMEAGYVFVTTNRLLARESRQFLITEKVIRGFHVPPALHVGQASTIAWLLRRQTLAPEIAQRDLLANCYAAMRPDAAWLDNFRRVIEGEVGPINEFIASGEGALTLRAARRIAQDESFGNPALVKQLGVAEVLARAEREAAEHIERIVNDKATAISDARAKATADAINQTKTEIENRRQLKAAQLSRRAIEVVQYLLIVAAILAYISNAYHGDVGGRPVSWVLAIIGILGVCDLFGLPLVGALFDRAREHTAKIIYGWLEV